MQDIKGNLQIAPNQMTKPGPYRTLQMGPAYSSGLAQTVYIYKIQKWSSIYLKIFLNI